jgi:hypothetical protein
MGPDEPGRVSVPFVMSQTPAVVQAFNGLWPNDVGRGCLAVAPVSVVVEVELVRR